LTTSVRALNRYLKSFLLTSCSFSLLTLPLLDIILQTASDAETSSIGKVTGLSTRDNAIKEGFLELQELSTTLEITSNALSTIDTTDFPAFQPLAAQLRELTSQAGTASAAILSGILSSHKFPPTTTTAGTDEIPLTSQSSSSRGPRRQLHEQRRHARAKEPLWETVTSLPADWVSFQQMQDAEINGGETDFSEMMKRHLQQATGRSGRSRKLQEDADTDDAATMKKRRCSNLVNCAGKMSLYDLIISFYEDDIDFSSSLFSRSEDDAFDENVEKFDDSNFLEKQMHIKDAVTAAEEFLANQNPAFITGDACDLLLEEFHRVEENDGISSWKGSSVTEVCLAEGTLAYVSFADISRPKNLGSMIGNQVFNDFVVCAERIFKIRPHMFQDDTFVFKDPITELIRVPTSVRSIKDRGFMPPHGQPTNLTTEAFYEFRELLGKFVLVIELSRPQAMEREGTGI
jgi:hypothetical protein